MSLFVFTCVGVDADLPYLPHFLRHYRALGVPDDGFRVILQAADEASPALAEARAILSAEGIEPAMTWIGDYTSRGMWERRRALQAETAGPADDVLSADVDEFHEYPAPLDEIRSWYRHAGYDVVQGPFIDRLAADGSLAPIPGPETPIDRAFPLQTELRHAIAGITEDVNLGGSVKLMLVRGDVLPGLGGHGAYAEHRERPHALGIHLSEFPKLADPRVRFRLPFLVHHYKWTEGLERRMRRRLETPGITPAGRAYAEALLNYFDRGEAVRTATLAFRDPARHAARNWRARVALARAASLAKRGKNRLTRLGRRLRPAGGDA